MRFLFFLAIVFLLGCKGRPGSSQQKVTASADTLITIIPFHTGLRTPFTQNDRPVSLNPSSFASIDSLVRSAVKNYNEAIPNEKRASVGINLDRTLYRRQYIAGVNSAGDTLVWVNSFCDMHLPESWRNQLVFVEDGGNCYFNLTVNLTKRTVADMIVNGHG